MTVARSGFRADSYKKIVVGPGAVVLNYGLPGERLLGATRGGNTFNPGVTYRDIEADKAYGMVKGLRLIDDIQPQIVSNLLELGADNLKIAIPGLRTYAGSGTASVVAFYAGSGDGTEVEFGLGHPDVVPTTVRVYVNSVLVPAGDYVVRNPGDVGHSGGANAEIEFSTAVPNGEAVTASYSYSTGSAATHEILRINSLSDEDYIENVAILGTALGYDQPFIGIIRNAVGEGGIEINLQNKDEGVVEVTFTGMFTGQGLEDLTLGNAELADVAPFEIRWPNEGS